MKTFLCLAAALLALALPAAAWDPIGHMIVGQTAYDNLTPAAKKAVDESVAAMNKKNGTEYTFVSAGCWMDDIRGQTKEYNTWHYINLPYTPEGTPLPGPAEENALWGILLMSDIIAGKNTRAGLDKDDALFVLIHLVGDIHQPLHTTSRDDAGGNKVDVPNLKDPAVVIFPTRKNLHTFWDTSYRRVFKDGMAAELYPEPPYLIDEAVKGHNKAAALVREQAGELRKGYDPALFPATGTPGEWILESHRQGYAQGYGKLPGGDASNPVTLDAAYIDQARELANQKLIQAGLRLANLLNSLYQ